MQNITDIKTLVIDKIIPSIKAIVSRKRLDISIKKVRYIINSYNTNGYLYKKTYNLLEYKEV